MKKSRYLPIALASLSVTAFIACGGSDEIGDDGSGGSGASAGSGASGSGATGGSSGNSGSGASAGTSSPPATGGSGSSTGGSGNGGSASGGSGSSSGGSASGGSAGAGSTGGSGASGGVGGSGTGGSSGGTGGTGGSAGGTAGTSGNGGGGTTPSAVKFSFFVTSLKAVQEFSKNKDGFGGDLRYGETGDGAGLRGADKICTAIAEKSMAKNAKVWRAFLSATKGENGSAVNAIDRVGNGPWYDRLGRLLAQSKADLALTRPKGADAAIKDDFPNEDGVPNHAPDPGAGQVDNHDFLTGSNETGKLYSTSPGATCNDWTSAEGATGKPRVGHSWPRKGSGENWMSALNEAGCAPGAFLIERGGPGANGTKSVGDGGGYGGFYCFALSP